MTSNCPNCRGFLLPAALVLAAAVALAVDVPIARAFRAWNQSETIHGCLAFFDMFEMFGHGLGVAVLLVALHQLDPGRRWAIPRVLACALAAGGLADVLKMFVLRTRPYECALDGTVWTTFGPVVPDLRRRQPGTEFPLGPYGHGRWAGSRLDVALPQGRLLFTLLAVLVGCQRIVCGAHYPSDVLIGAAAGCLVAPFFLRVGRIPRWFDRWEERWRASGSRRCVKRTTACGAFHAPYETVPDTADRDGRTRIGCGRRRNTAATSATFHSGTAITSPGRSGGSSLADNC